MTGRLSGSVIGVSLFALLVITVIGLSTGRDLRRDLDEGRLTALQSSGASDVAAHVAGLQRTTATLAASPQAGAGLRAFAEGHRALLTAEIESLERRRRDIADAYRLEILEPLSSARLEVELRDIVPDNPAAVHLQYHYAVELGPEIEPASIDDARDGSAWTEAHATLHPVYREVVDRLDLLDLYLVEPDAGHIVYSVGKRPDLGTSLVAGQFSGSALSTAIDQIRGDSGPDQVTTDLVFYPPTGIRPVGFVASRVDDAGGLAGFLVLAFDAAALDDILSAGQDWEGSGFPPTAQTLLFGSDGKVRSEPRTFVEDPPGHLAASVDNGLNEADQTAIVATGTTVLVQSVPAATLSAAVDDPGTLVQGVSLVGSPTLSVAGAVALPDLDWFVVAEMDVEVAERGVDDFARALLLGVAAIVVGLAFLAVTWSGWLIAPIRRISEQLGDRFGTGGAARVRIDVPARAPSEFHELADSFETMATRIAEQQGRVAELREERLRLLRHMVPPAVAERLAAGRVQAVEEVPRASVVVVVVLGLGRLLRADAAGTDREILDEVLAELDDLAAEHRLERINVVGDAYFAGCGHDRPLIDHAPRAVAFAIDARETIRDLGRPAPSGLETAIGIHTGPVLSGMTGADGSVYDVWGETVTTAHRLARSADRGGIVVSEETRQLLPDGVELTASDDDGRTWVVSPAPMRGQP